MDIKVERCIRKLALDVIEKNPSAHVDYFHSDGTVDLIINDVFIITHSKKNDIYAILSMNGHFVFMPYVSYYQIVIC